MHEKTHLPCELVGLRGRCRNKQHRCDEEKSRLKWLIPFHEILRPSKKLFEQKRNFLEQIVDLKVIVIRDFKRYVESECKISDDKNA